MRIDMKIKKEKGNFIIRWKINKSEKNIKTPKT